MPRLLSPQAQTTLTYILIPITAAVLLCNTHNLSGARALPLITTTSPSVLALLFIVFLSALNFCIYKIFLNLKPQRGLDPLILEKLPVVRYNEIRRFRTLDGELMCSICLDEFEPEAELRLSPQHCRHVHHRSCIDEWLRCNVSCPYCRADFSKDGEGQKREFVGVFDEGEASRREGNARYWRWHSNGNEGGERDGDERFAVEVPESVWAEVLARHRRCKSFAASDGDGQKRRRLYWFRRWSGKRGDVRGFWRSSSSSSEGDERSSGGRR